MKEEECQLRVKKKGYDFMKQSKIRILWAVLFVLPAFLLVGLFLLYPVFETVRLSFFKWSGVAGAKEIFVGLDNFRAVFGSPKFWLALRNSLFFMLGGFFVLMPLAFLLAKIITSKMRGVRFFKVSYYLPVMLPITAVGLIWVYLLNPDWGLVNGVLEKLGMGSLGKDWLGVPTLNVITVVLVNEWIFAGFNMLIFAAGLVAIPEEVYEAAKIDGANKRTTLFYVTLPMMKEAFQVFTVLCISGSLKTFDLMFAMTGGGPNHSSEVPATLLYSEAFSSRSFGRGNAIGVIILSLGLILSLSISKVFKDRKD